MKVVKYSILILLFSSVGFFVHKNFFELSLSQLQFENITLTNRTISGRFSAHIIFALCLGTIPLLYFVVEKLTRILFIYKGLMASLLIVCSGFISWKIRIYCLNNEFKFLSGYDMPNNIPIHVDLNDFNFGWYLFFGFIVGTILSILMYRIQNNSSTT